MNNEVKFTVTPLDAFGDNWEADICTGDVRIPLEKGSKRECYEAIERVQKAETFERKPLKGK